MIWTKTGWPPHDLGKLAWYAANSRCSEAVARKNVKAAVSGAAQAVRLVKDCIEHRSKVTGRAVDNRQNFRNRGLLCVGLIALGSTLCKLPPQIGDDLLR